MMSILGEWKRLNKRLKQTLPEKTMNADVRISPMKYSGLAGYWQRMALVAGLRISILLSLAMLVVRTDIRAGSMFSMRRPLQRGLSSRVHMMIVVGNKLQRT